MKLTYIKASSVRKLAKSRNRRISTAFLESLDRMVADKIETACADHNGGRRTLDQGIATMYLGPRFQTRS